MGREFCQGRCLSVRSKSGVTPCSPEAERREGDRLGTVDAISVKSMSLWLIFFKYVRVRGVREMTGMMPW